MSSTSCQGMIACGHPATASAAEEILLDGGNAFDAIVAAHFAACVAEPVLASLGGGGYLLAHPLDRDPIAYDFFNQTPRHKKPESDIEFYAMLADFGTAQQEFHIGLGSMATPGAIRGMFAIHGDLCKLPMRRLVQPAARLAREGVVFNHFQSYIFDIIAPIFTATEEARSIYTSDGKTLIREGETLIQTAMADTLVALGEEKEDLFYEGDIAQRLAEHCQHQGGHLTLEDLKHYEVIRRQPLTRQYRKARLYTNPPPSSGGTLIAFALSLLETENLASLGWHSPEHLGLLADIMALTNKARIDAHLDDDDSPISHDHHLKQLLDPVLLEQYRQQIHQRSQCLRGTTHLTVMDQYGNSAAMTVSNGEGCGHILPGTGIMLNNVLGEEDLNPGGFHRWQPNQRMTSMMAPSLIETDNQRIALGSGGSNRLRTAILQVISNLVDFGMSPEQAVDSARIHVENELLNIEQVNGEVPASLLQAYPQHRLWPERSLFFGGVHTVVQMAERFNGAGDPRRGGVAVRVGI
ncbi:gamma-glutamyltransferase [Pseudomaricurvus alkylphenolicus]|uniref:gamma-glutamyltransferase n=1 Tax=Pseudomaricurvus alkylphenolicus TaxID=1306991 RepID=UPI00197CE1B8